jgi:hypothetical protein
MKSKMSGEDEMNKQLEKIKLLIKVWPSLPINKMYKWFSNNSSLILTVVQTIIAFFMLWTLIQNKQTLNVTTRQLESTIDPVLTPQMLGDKIHITNDGSIEVKQVCITALIVGWFDLNVNNISEYQVNRPYIVLQDTLLPRKSFDIDLKSYLPLISPDKSKDLSKGMSICGITCTYRRTADMKPFVIFLPFSFIKGTETKSTDFFFPLFPSVGSSEASFTNNASSFFEEARRGLIELYKNKIEPVQIE